MVAMSRVERMVAHDITGAPFLFAVMVRRRTFFLRGSFDCTFHVVAERLATRRSRGEAMFRGGSFDRSGAESFVRNGNGTVESNFPILIGFGRLKEPTHNISPAAWNRTWSPQGCGARERWQSAASKGFFNGTKVVSIAAPATQPR